MVLLHTFARLTLVFCLYHIDDLALFHATVAKRTLSLAQAPLSLFAPCAFVLFGWLVKKAHVAHLLVLDTFLFNLKYFKVKMALILIDCVESGAIISID